MSVDFRPMQPSSSSESDIEPLLSAGPDAGASSFAGRLHGALAPTLAHALGKAAPEAPRRRASTPVFGIERGATRAVPHVDVSQVATLHLASADVPCVARFEGVAQLLSPLARMAGGGRMSLSEETDDRAPPRERSRNQLAEAEGAQAGGDEPAERAPSRAQTPDAAVSRAAAAHLAPSASEPHPRTLTVMAPAARRASEAGASAAEAPAPAAIVARMARALASSVGHGQNPLVAQPPPSVVKPEGASEAQKIPAPASAPAAAVPARAGSPSAPPLPAAPSPLVPARTSSVSKPAPRPSLTAPVSLPSAGAAEAAPPPASAPAAGRTSPARYAAPETADASEAHLPHVRWKAGEAHVSVKTDVGDLSLHVRVKDGMTDIAAAGPAARHLRAAAAHLQAQLHQEGLSLGRFATQTGSSVASLDHVMDPFARQDPDEDDGTASAEGDDQRLISGKGRSRSLRRLHVKA